VIFGVTSSIVKWKGSLDMLGIEVIAAQWNTLVCLVFANNYPSDGRETLSGNECSALEVRLRLGFRSNFLFSSKESREKKGT